MVKVLIMMLVEFPDQATQVVLDGMHITSVAEEDLHYFSHLVSVDMSDNSVTTKLIIKRV